jgi:hypothetical protein
MTTNETYRVVRQREGGRVLRDGIWQTDSVTVATVATKLSRADADAMVREDRRVQNMRAGLAGYWLTSEVEN